MLVTCLWCRVYLVVICHQDMPFDALKRHVFPRHLQLRCLLVIQLQQNPDPSRWFRVCGAITMTQAPYNGVASSIWDLYKVCCITGNQLLGWQDPQPQLSPCLLVILLHQNPDPSGWFQVCGAITMAQAPCYGIASSIWEIYTVCCINGNQLLGSHDPQHQPSPWKLVRQIGINVLSTVCGLIQR